MCIDTNRYAERTSQAKVSQLDHSIVAYQKVLRLEVTMQDTMRVAIDNTQANLVQEALQGRNREHTKPETHTHND